jgi:hypothetical protein
MTCKFFWIDLISFLKKNNSHGFNFEFQKLKKPIINQKLIKSKFIKNNHTNNLLIHFGLIRF